MSILLPSNPCRPTRALTRELSRRESLLLPLGNFTIARGLERTSTLCVPRECPRHLEYIYVRGSARERGPYARANRPDEARKTHSHYVHARTHARATRRTPDVLLYFTLVDAETPGIICANEPQLFKGVHTWRGWLFVSFSLTFFLSFLPSVVGPRRAFCLSAGRAACIDSRRHRHVDVGEVANS